MTSTYPEKGGYRMCGVYKGEKGFPTEGTLSLPQNPDIRACALSRVFLQFDGVNNAFYVWVNGKPVGYSQDSCLPAEFDVSDFLKEGRNLISVQVPGHPASNLDGSQKSFQGSLSACVKVLLLQNHASLRHFQDVAVCCLSSTESMHYQSPLE